MASIAFTVCGCFSVSFLGPLSSILVSWKSFEAQHHEGSLICLIAARRREERGRGREEKGPISEEAQVYPSQKFVQQNCAIIGLIRESKM